MTFIEAVKSGFQNYFNFKTRASRSEYWWWTAFTIFVFFSVCIIVPIVAIGVLANGETIMLLLIAWLKLFHIPIIIFLVIFLLPSIAVTARRLQDVGLPGSLQLIGLSGIGSFFLLYCFIQRGDEGRNKYGENPLESNTQPEASPLATTKTGNTVRLEDRKEPTFGKSGHTTNNDRTDNKSIAEPAKQNNSFEGHGENTDKSINDPVESFCSPKRRPINLGIYIISIYLIGSAARPIIMWVALFGQSVGIENFLNMIKFSASNTAENDLAIAVATKFLVASLFILFAFFRVRYFRLCASIVLILGALFYGFVMFSVPVKLGTGGPSAAIIVHPAIAIAIAIYLFRRKKVAEVYGKREKDNQHIKTPWILLLITLVCAIAYVSYVARNDGQEDAAENSVLEVSDEVSDVDCHSVSADSGHEDILYCARQGNAEAQWLAGISLEAAAGFVDLGKSSFKKEAARWMRLAAEQGHANAQYEFGRRNQIGDGIPQNYSEAVKWYGLAADQGNPMAQFNLYPLYSLGRGVPRNAAYGFMLLSLAAESGYEPAVKFIEQARGLLTPDQLAEAERLLSVWKVEHQQ
jgi:uncharacterized membrane protein YhaH (DUF805 family)